MRLINYWLALIGLAFFVMGCSPKAHIVSLSGATMGTTYHVKFVTNETVNSQQIQAEIDALLGKVNDQMSTYQLDSELSQFNQMGIGEMAVSADTIKVAAAALALYQLTDGALDVSLGPLVNLWGFGPDKRPLKAPTDEQIKRTQLQTGIHQFAIEGNRLIKYDSALYIDLSSIAKGYGVDVIASYLQGSGYVNFLAEIGGEVRTNGTKPDGQPWRIAIEKPNSEGRSIQSVIAPGNLGLATSGDYRNYFEENGQRLSHLIDPRTGKPIAHNLASVTVLHESVMIADGLATALIVMGTEAGLALANKENLAVMFIERSAEQYKVIYSQSFERFLNKELE
ncbi:FAD:protein FMN transferase [Paraferrimonas sp. SM1919]|uniref:FAD:protein FMN transferase n=1 Tax=Paraferrimonas sp. SM1919 TaxID=2662263 RepID=UPI0013D71E35|nr:FAD:protein FMN transferase [Paraferrimonas sp. SM1919]